MVRLSATWLLGVLCLAGAQLATLRVDESRTGVVLRSSQSAVVLALENSAGRPIAAEVELAWLRPNGVPMIPVTRELSLPPGRSAPLIALPLPQEGDDGLAWYRLRYRVLAEGSVRQGILALSEIASHVFELRASAPRMARPGRLYRVLVQAAHPTSGKPVSGVSVRGILALDPPVEVRALSDRNGTATLEFHLPDRAGAANAELTVEGSMGDFRQDASLDVEFARGVQILVQSDKPLYQPGQTLHTRVVCFNAAGRAAANLPLRVRAMDAENTTAFVAELATNRLGVAAVDWEIPGNIRLGDLLVRAETGKSDEDLAGTGMLQVKVSRYDLPEFAVTAKTDRGYYLPGQTAEVEVRADYLFGKPVTAAQVRVVREADRQWNYRLQKWDIEEGESYEGEIDAAGRFVARLDLKAGHEDLDKHHRFEDLTFTAYVRDASSGRTEQRRFDVRATRDAVHIYVLNRGRTSSRYVSTAYADGKPASCRVTGKGISPVMTNRYGLARIAVPKELDELELQADDGQGARGQTAEWVSSDDPSVRVSVDKTLYRPGERIQVDVASQKPIPIAVLEVVKDATVLESRWLDLTSRHARIVIPWRKEYAHEITIGVTSTENDSDSDARTVLFPADRDLRLVIAPAQPVYRPGDEAGASITARLPNGKPVAAALGVAVVDAAVGERTQSDAEPRWRSFGRWYHPSFVEVNGVTRDDLYRLDLSKPFPEGLDLLAEAMLADDGYWPGASRSGEDIESAFRGPFEGQFRLAMRALDALYEKDLHNPRDLETLRRDLQQGGIGLDSMRDPWDTPYLAVFDIAGPWHRLRFMSAGPDKRFETADDLVAATVQRPFFATARVAVAAALNVASPFPQSEKAALAFLGEKIDQRLLIDPWGTPYRLEFRINGPQAVLGFRSAGPDRRFQTTDDVEAGFVQGRYFAETERKIAAILQSGPSFPSDEGEFRALLAASGLGGLTDPWGQPVYVSVTESQAYADLARFYDYTKYGGGSRVRSVTIPVTTRTRWIHVRSAGPDGKAGTRDDFMLAEFSRKVSSEAARQQATEGKPQPEAPDTGLIVGMVADPTGAVVSGATVRAVRIGNAPSLQYTTATGSEGIYLLAALPEGTYEVRVEIPGFRSFVIGAVPVTRRKATTVDAQLSIGSVSEAVEVRAEAPHLTTMTSSAARSAIVEPSAPVTSTPRLREYFPETLLWQPLLETGPDGRARLSFKLADNITTWKVAITGSTVTGEVGTATADIRAFQSFFIDHNPPRTLTQGDRIELPVTIRNYLERPETVAVTMAPQGWFELTGNALQQVRVDAGASASAVFAMRAIAAVADGKQRLTAAGSSASDAIEKPVTVHPDGNAITQTQNAVFSDQGVFDIDIPENKIEGWASTEVKIYPNVLSHVVESVEGVLRRPYGCAEQAISSAYPSLLVLRLLKRTGRQDDGLQAKAKRYLQAGVDRLLSYRTGSGGFSYWSRGNADFSLTAYAIRFLGDAAEFVAIDQEVVKSTRAWILKQQAAGGEWPAKAWDPLSTERLTLYQTAAIAMDLSSSGASSEVKPALDYLAGRASQIDEPYAIAALAIAAERSGQSAVAAAALDQLRRLARSEGGLAYWNIETNTPFYGWGLAGRLETSALAARALVNSGQPGDRALADSGLLFLLRNKDGFGVWYSTQATARVLDAIIDAAAGAPGAGIAGSAEILLDGRAVGKLAMPDAGRITGPISVDLPADIARGRHRVTIRRADSGSASQAQLVTSY
jgi:hypothetical protein